MSAEDDEKEEQIPLDKEPVAEGHLDDHEMIIALRQKVMDNTIRLNVHNTQIMGVFGSIATAFGVLLLVIYQFILPPLNDKDRIFISDQKEIERSVTENHTRLDGLKSELNITNDRINRLYELFRDLNDGQKKKP